MDFINKILRGAVIGVANIIPGVSGGTMMVSMGIYDTLIHSITHLFKEFKKSITALLPYAIGMLIGILALAGVLKYLFANYPLPTYTAFIGLILGGLKPLVRKIDTKKLKAVSIVLFILFFVLIVIMPLLNSTPNPDSIEANAGNMLIMLLVGCVAAVTMIIPGVSGSMVLMLLGYYTPVLNALDTLKNAIMHMQIGAVWQPLMLLAPFGIGVVVGIFGVAKLIEWLLARFPQQTYCAVLGLVVASPIAILLKAGINQVTIVLLLISILTFALGFIAAMLLSKYSEK